MWFCPGVSVHKGITIVHSLFMSHWLAVVYCLVLYRLNRYTRTEPNLSMSFYMYMYRDSVFTFIVVYSYTFLVMFQVLQHPWVVSRYQLPVHRLHQVSSVSRIKEAVKATFSALSSPDNKRLKPVHASLLAQRRTTKKSPK